MSITETKEKTFESNIEEFLISESGGYTKGDDTYEPSTGLFSKTFIQFIKNTQPKE